MLISQAQVAFMAAHLPIASHTIADMSPLMSHRAMASGRTDFSLSLEQLTGCAVGDAETAPTPMVAAIFRSWKKPLNQLSDEEIGRLVVQHDGYPYLLDLIWPKLEADPLFEGGYYPGDVLSNLIRAERSIWADRPEYEERLPTLYRRALARPEDENDSFRESLQLPDVGGSLN